MPPSDDRIVLYLSMLMNKAYSYLTLQTLTEDKRKMAAQNCEVVKDMIRALWPDRADLMINRAQSASLGDWVN